jgi:hypothetical protein
MVAGEGRYVGEGDEVPVVRACLAAGKPAPSGQQRHLNCSTHCQMQEKHCSDGKQFLDQENEMVVCLVLPTSLMRQSKMMSLTRAYYIWISTPAQI